VAADRVQAVLVKRQGLQVVRVVAVVMVVVAAQVAALQVVTHSAAV
jgi:hypothetical protein